jgi:hemerythrin-like domain-containing protein
MFSFISSLFFNKEKEEFKVYQSDNSEEVKVKNIAISYRPKLIKNCKNEHQILLGLYGKISSSLDNEEPEIILEHVKNFESQLMSHIRIENQYLYPYLKDYNSDSKNSEDLVPYVQDMQQSILPIVRTFRETMEKYNDKNLKSKRVRADLKKNLEAIAEVVVKRIEKEETHLYTLYKGD